MMHHRIVSLNFGNIASRSVSTILNDHPHPVIAVCRIAAIVASIDIILVLLHLIVALLR